VNKGKRSIQKKIPMSQTQKHPFHMVDPSPWPLVAAFSALLSTTGGVMYMHSYEGGGFALATGQLMILYSMYVWWRDIVREATFEGHHTQRVQVGLRYGVLLFIVSEIMFFFAFFWAFFHSSLSPAIELGGIWPPKGIDVLNPWDVPLLNTAILLLSGCTVTWAHHSLVCGDRQGATTGLILTVALGIIFTGFQIFEYYGATFTISDSVYGSTFYVATGFHGFHVLVGTVALAVCLVRQVLAHFTTTHHFGFEAAAWYWHFVDVVWLFLFVTIYWWGS